MKFKYYEHFYFSSIFSPRKDMHSLCTFLKIWVHYLHYLKKTLVFFFKHEEKFWLLNPEWQHPPCLLLTDVATSLCKAVMSLLSIFRVEIRGGKVFSILRTLENIQFLWNDYISSSIRIQFGFLRTKTHPLVICKITKTEKRWVFYQVQHFLQHAWLTTCWSTSSVSAHIFQEF